jgi:hypothetical protein
MAKDDEEAPSTDISVPIPRIPDVARPFLGFRSWRWNAALQRLTSIVQGGTLWTPGADQHAACPLKKDHLAAAPGCSCGI